MFDAHHVAGKKRSTRENYKGHLDRHFVKPFGDKRLDDIEYRDIVKITDKLTPSNRAYALAVIRIFWNFCRRRHLTKNNPVDTVQVRPPAGRDRVLSETELRAVWKATSEPCAYHCIVRLIILWGSRRNEVASLRRSWLTKTHVEWPKEAMKNSRPHRLPILPTARSIIGAPTGRRRLAISGPRPGHAA